MLGKETAITLKKVIAPLEDSGFYDLLRSLDTLRYPLGQCSNDS